MENKNSEEYYNNIISIDYIDDEIVILEGPQTTSAGDNNFACGFCNPIFTIK